eukprot:COSAG01_NODE_797_length_13523_cov_34.143027_13_plen_208_part_00
MQRGLDLLQSNFIAEGGAGDYVVKAEDIKGLKASYAAYMAELGVEDVADADDDKAAVWSEVVQVLESAQAVQQSKRELNCLKQDNAAATEVDPAVWRCRSINRLQLRLPEGTLTELSPKIQRFRQLDTLILSFNSLKRLPDSIGTLTKLRILEVAVSWAAPSASCADRHAPHLSNLRSCAHTERPCSPCAGRTTSSRCCRTLASGAG